MPNHLKIKAKLISNKSINQNVEIHALRAWSEFNGFAS